MTPEFPPIHNNDTIVTEVPVTVAAATATTTATAATQTRQAAAIKPFNLNSPTASAVPVPAFAQAPLTNSHVASNRLVGGNVEQQLTALLHELLTTTTTGTTTTTMTSASPTFSNSSNNATLCNSNSNMATITATGTRLLAAIAPAQTIPTATATATAGATTTLTTFTAIFPTATTNAFIQMNSSNFANCTGVSSSNSDGSGGGSSSTAVIITAATVSSNATDAPSVDSYLIGMAWPKALIVAIFLLLIFVTVVGNTLVILSVLTTRRLRTVTNCFVMNLAITDWLVGTCVMPPAVILYIVGSWRFGWILCDIWISLDVLLCTGSILSLCAISLDRYLAVTQPLTYSKKRRSKRLALFMILVVWVMALSITCPPYLGWYEPGRRQKGYVVCRYNQNKGYVVFSAMGSFFIPLAVMLYVYLKIGYVLTSRRQRIVRDANSERTADHEIDCDNFISESEHFQCATPKFPSFKRRWVNFSNGNSNCNGRAYSLHCSKCNKNFINESNASGGLKHEASFYELVEISRLTSLIQCSSISCKYGCTCLHSAAAVSVALADRRASTLPIQTLHYAESGASFSETCLATATTTTTNSTTAAIKFNQSCPHQSNQQAAAQHHQHHSHHSHRVPMRVSTTKRDTKTAKTLTIVMGGFIACWLPFFVYYLLIPFLPPAAVLEGLMSFLTWVGWVNCAINPFIYAFYNPDFRTAFWRLTCRRICKQKPPPNHLAMFRG